MIKYITTVMLIALPLIAINAQVGIGTTNPDPSSELHIESTDSGLLIPRMTSAQRDAIVNPANGLLIFNTDTNELQCNINSLVTPIWEAFSLIPTTSSIPGQSVKYSNTDITTNINTNAAINLPVCGTEEWNDNATLFVVNTATNSIIINETGRYKVIVNASFDVANNGPQRANPEIYIALDNVREGTVSSTGYMRRASGHNESSVNFTEVIEITAGQVLTLKILRAGNNGVVNLRAVGTSNVYIEKLL